LKRILIVFIILFVILVSTINVEVEYYTWRNRLDTEVSGLQVISGNPTSMSSSRINVPKYGIYMYLGCTVSSFASVFWHVTQAVKVCDRLNSDRLCDYKMTEDYDYNLLARKARAWLLSDRYAQMVDENEVLVKLDDDTIVSKDTLDEMVSQFADSDCLLAGMVRQAENGMFWNTGALYMVKTSHLKKQLKENSDVLSKYDKAEDVQFAELMNITDKNLVCSLDPNAFKHRYYEDGRISIRYKEYVKCN